MKLGKLYISSILTRSLTLRSKHYYDGSVEALQDVKQKMPVGWSKRDVNDETAATSPVFIGADGKARPIVLVSREAN